MLISLTVVIISLYICVSSHHVVHFKHIQFLLKIKSPKCCKYKPLAEMKNILDELISRLNMAKQRISDKNS